MSKNKTVFICAENTLVDNNSRLIESTVNRLKELKKQKYTIVLWSAKGRNYCETLISVHHLQKLIDFSVGKPDIIIDSDDYPLRESKIESPKFMKREFV